MNETKNLSWIPLILVACASFIIILDSTFMNVSLSQLIIDLNTDINTIQTIITFYTLITASLMLVGARLQDIIGKKKIFLIGAIIFGIGATIASLSQNPLMLFVGWSVLEGVGGALMTPATISIVSGTYSGENRTFALSIISATIGIGAAIGPLFGGVVTTFLTWRAGFIIELLVIIFVLIMSKKISKFPTKLEKSDFDLTGSILVIIGLILLVLGIINISEGGPSLGLIIAGIVILIAFIICENRRKKAGKTPLIDIAIAREHNLSLGTVIRLISNLTIAGAIFAVSIFLQSILHVDAFTTGLTLLPLSVGILIFSLIATKLTSKLSHKKVMVLGFIIAIVGGILLRTQFDLHTTVYDLIPGMFLLGAGLGLAISLSADVALFGTKKENESIASGFLSTGQTLGTSMGTAIIGTILIVGAIGGLHDSINLYYPDEITNEQFRLHSQEYIEHLSNVNLSSEHSVMVEEIVNHTIYDTMKLVIDVTVVLLAITAVLSLFIKNKKDYSVE